MRLDRRLEPIDPYLVLNPPDGVGHRSQIDDRRHLVVVRHPALELLVERVSGVLTNSDDRCADLGQPADKVALGRWKERLDKDDVHGGMLLAYRHSSPRSEVLGHRNSAPVGSLTAGHIRARKLRIGRKFEHRCRRPAQCRHE